MLSMRPQHNSTRTPARHAFDLVSECSNISPIMRSHAERPVDSGDEPNKCPGRWPLVNAEHNNEQDDDEIPIWICGEPRYISGITITTTCREIIQALIDDELHNDGETASAPDARRSPTQRRSKENCRQQPTTRQHYARDFAAASRDLGDYVITERWRDVEQALAADTHILPIWLAWGSARSEIRFKLKINKSKDGGWRYGHDDNGSNVVVGDAAGHLFVPPTHQHKQDKDTKKKRKFKALAKMMKRLVLQSETIQQCLSQLKPNEYQISKPTMIDVPEPTPSGLPKFAQPGKTLLLNNFLQDSATANGRDRPISTNEPRVLENIYVHICAHDDLDTMAPINIRSSATTTDDELFLLIEDDTNKRPDYTSDDLDSGVHVEYRQYVLNKKLQCNADAAAAAAAATAAVAAVVDTTHRLTDRLIQLSETPKRKYRTKCDFDRLRARSMSRAAISSKPPPPTTHRKPPSKRSLPQQQYSRGSAIRIEVAARLLDMDRLLQYEQQLLATQTRLSAQFRAQNEMYTVRHSCVGVATDFQRIQSQLDAYAKDIVDTECKVYKVQLEITQKCGILHNLQRMADNNDGDDIHVTTDTDGTDRSATNRMSDAVAERIAAEKCRHQQEMAALIGATENEEEFVDNVNEFCDINQSIIV